MAAGDSPNETIQQDGVTIIVLGQDHENLDDAMLEELRTYILDAIAAADPPLIGLDLSHVNFFGSAFIEVLFRAWNRIEKQGNGEFALCSLTPYCAEVIDVTHLNRLWAIYKTREEAVADLKAKHDSRSSD